MSYFIKYQLSFVSDRNNIYDLHILQKNYGGQPIVKKLGTAPVLSIEEGEGRVKGSSLSFSIQADVEGELKGLYTTNNKEFKVLLYRNSSLYWQGFLLPELYSENYIDPPYDVAVTATDQLGVLKNIQYNQEKGNKSLLEIITYILTLTQLDLKIVQHLNLTISGNERFLSGAYVSTEGYYGQSCYDVLNSILLSCNTCIQQYENEWVIMSLTDATTAFVKDGTVVNFPHVRLGQMGNAQVYPDGSLEMVNKPALKGVSLNYAHILKNSFLKNADCESKDGWQYSFVPTDNRFPGTVDEFGVLYKCNCWQLPQKDVAVNGALQLWQDVNVKADSTYNCQLSVDYRMDLGASLLLMAIIHEGVDGVTRRLTSEGWKEGGSATDKNSYINVTGTPSELWLTWAKDISDFSKYEKATVQFQLPAVDGVLRIGFINTTDTGYVNPLSGHIYLTKVYLTYMGIAGKASTTVVEEDATNAQEEISLVYGERVPATNEALAVLNTLRSSNGIPMEQFSLNSTSGVKSYDSYFLAMLQEMSRYYAVKKMQLQGSVMGGSPLRLLYADVFSGKIMRLVSGEYDLLQDCVGVLLEEVPDVWVDYETKVFATDNSVPGTSSSGVVTVGGGSGASLLAVNAKGEVYVKDDRVLSGVEADFSRVVLPDKKPAGSADKAYIYSQAPKIGEILDANAVNMQLVIDELVGLRDDFDALSDLLNDDVAGVINTWDEVVDFLNEYSESQDLASILSRMDADIDAVEKRVTTLEDLGLVRVREGSTYYIKSIYSIVSEGELISGRRASGSSSDVTGGGGISQVTAQMIVDALGYVPYSSQNPSGYITSSALNGYAKTSDIPSLSGYATEAWVEGKKYLTAIPSEYITETELSKTLGGYQTKITSSNKLAYSLISGTPTLATVATSGKYSDLSGTPSSLPASDVYDWAKAATKPTYTASEVGALSISGGTITGNLFANGYIGMGNYMTTKSHYLFVRDNTNADWIVTNKDWNVEYTLIHSGSIGSQKVERAKYIETLTIDGAYWYGDSYRIYGQWASGTTLDWKVDGYEVRVDKAKKLNIARTIWGRSFDGTADVWGGIDVNGYKETNSITKVADLGTTGLVINAASIRTNWGMCFWTEGNGRGMIQQQAFTSAATTYPICLQPFGGNVLIGTTSDNGHKLQVVGGDIYTSSYMHSLAYKTNDSYGLWKGSTFTSALSANDIALYGKIIHCDGNVLIGTATDNGNKLQVHQSNTANGDVALFESNATWNTLVLKLPNVNGWSFGCNTNEEYYFYSHRNGKVATITNTGNLIATGEVISSRRASSSDARLKDNINRLIAEDCLAMVRNLQPSSWDWKNDGKHSLGFIAQDVEQYMPYAVTRIKDDKLGEKLNLQYDQFFAPVVGAIQCLDSEVEQLKKRVKYLENKLQEYGYNRY